MKKIVAFVLMICLLACTAALAETSQFGILAADEYADERLAVLDSVAEPVSVIRNVGGVTVVLGQAYCEGDRVFFSYRVCADTDLIQLHEGAPEGLAWTQVLEDWVEGDIQAWYPDVKKEHDWLDGQGQRWLESPDCRVYNLYLADGTLTLTTGGNEIKQADGSIVGWRECQIPEEKIEEQESLSFGLQVRSDMMTKFQDGRTYKEHREPGEEILIPFTLKWNTDIRYLHGENKTAQYTAIASLKLGKVDTRGLLQLDSPEVVKLMKAGNGGDQIIYWNLYKDGILLHELSQQDTVDGGEESILFELRFPATEATEGLSLVPEYSQSGAHVEEAVKVSVTE